MLTGLASALVAVRQAVGDSCSADPVGQGKARLAFGAASPAVLETGVQEACSGLRVVGEGLYA